MARCGCAGAGSCNCAVVAGPSITVTGKGTKAAPYVIGGIPGGPPGEPGPPGDSAYQVAVDNGFVGDEAAWLSSLVGPTGPQGDSGVVVLEATDPDPDPVVTGVLYLRKVT